MESVRKGLPAGMPASTPADVRVMSRLPMNRWSYSTATDQFGAKPTSMPVPTAPPQRVLFAESNSTPELVTVPRHLSSATAAPPFTYQSQLFQGLPTGPANRPNSSILE